MDTKPPSFSTLLSATFLVAGTCIGGGMLALPVATGLSGFLPSVCVMVLSWAMMTITALFLMEATLWMEEGVHVITLSSRLLGPLGKWVSWVLFLFISYASLVAYTAGGGGLIARLINSFYHTHISIDMGSLIFILVFGGVVYLGNIIVGRVNSILFIALCAAYFALIGMGLDEIQTEYLFHRNWRAAWIALPILLTSFSFQTMVPSLTPYLKRNGKSLKKAIIYGTTITFFVYFLWQTIILGIVPLEGEEGLREALIKAQPATDFLSIHVHGPFLSQIANYFGFFALVTSFLGIALGLFDFLSDGLKIKETGFGKVVLAFLIIVPTYFFATQLERVFLTALDATGGFGDAILNGIIPCLMVWIGRYKLKYEGERFVPGGKPVISLVLLFYVATVIFVILMQLNILPSIFHSESL